MKEITGVREQNPGRVALDLLSIPPLVNRFIRRKLKATIQADMDVELSPLHFEIMRVLEDEGMLHPAKIGVKLLIAKAQMTHLIDKLVELGFVKKEMDPNDRRIFNITLTDKGHKTMDDRTRMVICAISENMASLPEKERNTLSDALRNLRDILFKFE